MKYRSLTFIVFIALAGVLRASPEEFDFKDPKGVNNVSFKTEAPVETIKGTTRDITVPIKMTYLKDKLKQRSGVDGDLLVLRANFNVKRSDFGINPGQMLNKVSDDIQLTLGVAGSAPRG